MKESRASLAVGAAAVALIGAVTVVHGMWTERWVKQADDGVLRAAAARLEDRFPAEFGDWRLDQEMETSPQELARAGAVGNVARLYRNTRTKAAVSAFVVCALPHHASGHTPDRCYPGAGFEIGESEHRHEVEMTDGREAETFTGTFRKTGQTLRVFWTYGIADKPADGKTAEGPAEKARVLRWVAPQIARIALAGEPYVYKLYAIVDQTKLGGSQATLEASRFMADLLPAFDAALAAEPRADADGEAAVEQGAEGQPG